MPKIRKIVKWCRFCCFSCKTVEVVKCPTDVQQVECNLGSGYGVTIACDSGKFYYWIDRQCGNVRTTTNNNAAAHWTKRPLNNDGDYFMLHNGTGYVSVNESRDLEICCRSAIENDVQVETSACDRNENADNRLFYVIDCPKEGPECAGQWLCHLRTGLYVRRVDDGKLVCTEVGHRVVME